MSTQNNHSSKSSGAICRRTFWARVISLGLTIFAMLFGAGNLMFPVRVGMDSGSKVLWGFLGFSLTGVFLPLLGLIAIVLFSGDYTKFFERLGSFWGSLFIAFSMFIIGPIVVMPRIVMLSYEMMQPFLPAMSPLLYGLMFLTLIFFASYQKDKLLDIIGKVLSPLKVATLFLLVGIGLFTGAGWAQVGASGWKLFLDGAQNGYYTLDLLGAIFFGSMIVSLLSTYGTSTEGGQCVPSKKETIKTVGLASCVAAALLFVVYGGMSLLGALHGSGLENLNEGQILSSITCAILGKFGGLVVGLTIFLACFITTTSLAAVVSEYTHRVIFRKKVAYIPSLLLVLTTCALVARNGLAFVLSFSVPIIIATYPLFIVIAVCNILYKVWGVRMIKTPVVLMALWIGWTLVRSKFGL